MASLDEIQVLVNEAQDAILDHNSEVAKKLWTQIKDAIRNCDDLNRGKKSDLVLIVGDHLEKLGLEGRKEPKRSLKDLMNQPVPPQQSVHWPPW